MISQRRINGDRYLAMIFLLSWVLISVLSYFLVAVPNQNRFDFYPRWVGARAVLAGKNPYAQEVTWRIQEGMFGQRLNANEDQHRFAYPATIAWILLPFWLLPFSTAISLWCGLGLLILLILPVIVSNLLRWKIPSYQLGTLLLFSVLFYRYSINSYVLGQFTPFVLACLVGAWWAVAHDQPMLALSALVGVTIRFEMAPLVLALLFALWRRGQRRAVSMWFGLMGMLWLLTDLRIGLWEFDFINNVTTYAGYARLLWPPLLLGPPWAALLAGGGVLVWGGWMLAQLCCVPGDARLSWEISVVVIMVLLLMPQTGNYTLLLGLVPIWVALWSDRDQASTWLMTSFILISPWAFYLGQFILPMPFEQLLLPLVLGGWLTYRWRSWAMRVGGEALDVSG